MDLKVTWVNSHRCSSALRKPYMELVRADKNHDKPGSPSQSPGELSHFF